MPLTLVYLLATLAPAADPARPELLIEATDLARARDVRVIDVRGKDDYARGHVPGAVRVDAAAWDKAFTSEPGAEAWGKRLGGAGIDLDTAVVVYGGEDVRDAVRVWWILRYWGVKDVRVLNGGWAAWRVAEGKVATDETKPEPKAVTPSPRRERLASKDDVLQTLKGKTQIIDARSEGEFCGVKETAKRNGSIPGAKHLEWTEVLDPKTKRFKAPAELRVLFKEHGIDPEQPAVTYCQSGGRAAVMAFTLELMGGKQVQNYYRSWSEWGNDPDTPIVKPQPKK
jgi:thiosulfate/3-mercaptopyruvate sulfurtransferase